MSTRASSESDCKVLYIQFSYILLPTETVNDLVHASRRAATIRVDDIACNPGDLTVVPVADNSSMMARWTFFISAKFYYNTQFWRDFARSVAEITNMRSAEIHDIHLVMCPPREDLEERHYYDARKTLKW